MSVVPFEYVAAGSLSEAVTAASAPGARVIAGGHSLIPLMKLRLATPEVLVDIGRLRGLQAIEATDEAIEIGATVTHAAAAGSDEVRTRASALADAAAVVGDPAVRGMGTVGGSAAHADPVADEPGALLALGAEMVAVGPGGERVIPAAEFFLGPLTTALAPGEVLTSIRLPKRPGSSAYLKLGRRGPGSDYPIAGAAAWVHLEAGAVVGAVVAVTGAAATATLLPEVGEALVGTDGSAGAVGAAVTRTGDSLRPIADIYGSAEYKGHLAAVFAGRALQAAMRRTSREP